MEPKIRIRYAPDFPEKLREECDPLIDFYFGLAWKLADRIWVEYDNTVHEETNIKVARHYRQATLTFSGNFLALDAETQEEFIAHEAAHIFTDPLRRAAAELVDCFVAEEAQEYVFSQIVSANEASTDDLSRLFVAWRKTLDTAASSP